ncbi:hypothetical protein J0818_29500 [Bacillus cereus]|uniref:Group-specific protein n=1 Tax=Bacillus mobilis TaxID=2026190 RepID=A0A1Y5ZWR0_9BACI|nr:MULTISPECIES: hypothetical protein [Bacillus cereus group]MBL3741319.1 hypothetical protein [Bacillus cereus]MBL3864121.1 hypothetical protein [Bacillus cereus]SME16924.1 hypothetical protein BACERE00185_03145 [Bacillus mobilis]HDR6770144.1 hypothetical protein [Bacillus cereus]
MHQFSYINSKDNKELYSTHNVIPQLYSQPQIPEFGGINVLEIPEGWSCRVYPVALGSTADHVGFNFPKPPVSSFHYTGMMPQANWDPLAGYAGFTSPKQPFHHAAMFPHGHFSTLPPSANPFIFNVNGQSMNWNTFGNHTGWGEQGNFMGWGGPWAPTGWGNNGANGQPGMLGNLLTMGKNTMNGIGMINSLIGMGKFFF